MYDRRSGTRIRKTFANLAEAKSWRAEATTGLRNGTIRAAAGGTLSDAAEAWLDGAHAGTVRTRSGDRYKPSALRGYEAALRNRILPELGAVKLTDLRRADVQDLADHLLANGLDPSTIRNALMPLRAIYRRALARGDVVVNPTSGLELPAVRGRRDRIASPAEAARLLAALGEQDRAVWAAALYGGLRRGELMALRWEDIDLNAGVIRVVRGWDLRAGAIETKNSRRRAVPIIAILRHHLNEHQERTQRETGLVFGRTPERPFEPVSLRARALASWKKAGLDPISLHEGRHTFASLMIASRVNAKALTAYMGHSSIVISHDRYGHLMPGSDTEAIALIDSYLARSETTQSRSPFAGMEGLPHEA